MLTAFISPCGTAFKQTCIEKEHKIFCWTHNKWFEPRTRCVSCKHEEKLRRDEERHIAEAAKASEEKAKADAWWNEGKPPKKEKKEKPKTGKKANKR